MVVSQTFSYKILAPITDLRLGRENNLTSIQNSLVSHDGHLGFIMPERFHTEEQFKKDNTNRPNIYFRCYQWIIQVETFWCLIPISTDTLARELYFVLTGI
jgi:hypothetical protein